jgi:hypothetical protein
MYSRLVLPLICAAAVVFACGLPTHSASRPAFGALDGGVARARAGRTPAKAHRKKGDTVSVDAAFDVASDQRGVRLALSVMNVSKKKVEIDFPDGRTREFVVLDASGREVWRWSTGRLFTQTVQNRFLAAGDTAVYEERWAAARPGEYTAVAVLRSRNFPVERRMTFTVGPTTVASAATR